LLIRSVITNILLYSIFNPGSLDLGSFII
jgi:hypothetical protein